jgi:hypothetical protein
VKLIIVNDYYGHSHAVEYNDANMRLLLRDIIEADKVNSVLESRSDAVALWMRSPTAAEIEAHLQTETFPCGRTCGGCGVHFVDVSPAWAFTTNPFT